MQSSESRSKTSREYAIIEKEYEIIIGMEVHVQLATRSKMFCRCEIDADGLPIGIQLTAPGFARVHFPGACICR